MPELRQDPISGHWVIFAKERAQRPHDFVASPRRVSSGACPFCEGNEQHTPGELLAYRDAGTRPDSVGWRVRVVPNKFPAVELDAELDKSRVAGSFAGSGAHEVIIESPRHAISLTELSDNAVAEVFACYRERILNLRGDKRLKLAVVFKNVGADAGASIEHVHSQLLALPLVPPTILSELHGAKTLYDRGGRCAFCDMLDATSADRIVLANEDFVAICPFAPRMAYETWILPRIHHAQFEECTPQQARAAGVFARRVLQKMEAVLEQAAYNYIIHSAPFDMCGAAHYHWHIEVIPRVTSTAGFEWGSGMFINAVPPEEAAAILRQEATRAHGDGS